MFDVGIIGAGVVGCAIARELSRYNVSVCLIEKCGDVSCGASKANSGIVHGGYSAKAGTLKGLLCGRGNSMFAALEEELHFGYRKTGALIIGFTDEDKNTIHGLYQNGVKNGYADTLEIIGPERIVEIEPHINPEVKIALYDSSVGVASPFEMAFALAENAVQNGVKLSLESEVIGIEQRQGYFAVITTKGDYECRYVVNAAGVYSDKIAQMVGINDFQILPRRGQYILLGKDQGHLINSVTFQCPTKMGKGVLVTTTFHRNLMIGPDAEDTASRDDTGTTEEALKLIVKTARLSVPGFDIKKAITTFSGVRAVSSTGDFVIGRTAVPGFINAAGIDSPGLTSSPAIAKTVCDLLGKAGLELNPNKAFNPFRRGIIVKKDTNFRGSTEDTSPENHIICRCERVTEAEIIDALHRGIPVRSIDAVKLRTRAGMGPCQGTFCRPRVRALLSRELGIPEEEIPQRGNVSPQPERVPILAIRKFDM